MEEFTIIISDTRYLKPPTRRLRADILLMIEVLHYLKDPQLWNCGIFLIMGTAGFISSTVLFEPGFL